MERRDQSRNAPRAGAALRSRLDRAVMIALAMRLAGWLGRLAVCAVVAFASVALVNRLLAPVGVAIGRGPVIAAVLVAAAVAWCRWGGRAPTRLDVARAIEAAHVDVGERISRAVAFLDRPAGDVREPPLTAGLRELAVEDAAGAVAAIRRLPVPGLKDHMPWAVVGSMAVLAWIVSTQMVPRESVEHAARREVRSPAAPANAVAVDHVAAARLAAVAAVESRLAKILARRFSSAPGQMVDSLPEPQQRDLAMLAGVHEESLRTVRGIRSELAACDTPVARAAWQQLESLEDKSGDTIGHAIIINRLATAATGLQQWADRLTAVVRLLGGEGADAAVTLSQLPPRELVQVRRAEASLAAIEQRPPDGGQHGDAGRVAAVVGREAAEREPLPGGAERPGGPPGSEPAGEATEAATSEPRFAAGDADIIRPLDEAATPQARVWSLLPTALRSAARSGGTADVPADYRAAVDLYYQLVLKSLMAEPAGKRAP